MACLDEVKRQAHESEFLQREATIIHDIRLEGTFPETRIVVDVERFDKHQVVDWTLWDESNGDFGEPAADGEPEPPSSVARDIMVFLYEF